MLHSAEHSTLSSLDSNSFKDHTSDVKFPERHSEMPITDLRKIQSPSQIEVCEQSIASATYCVKPTLT